MSTDPFNNDTDKFRQLLDQDSNQIADCEAEEVEVVAAKNFLSSHTVKGLPPDVFKLAKQAQENLNLDNQKKQQVAEAFNNLFKDLNEKYGLQVKLDFDSFENTLDYMIKPVNKKAAEYYLSTAYGAFRVTLYTQYLQAIALLSAQVLDPAYILSESMTYDQKLDTLEKLYNFMLTMNEIYKEVNVPDTEVKLEKLSSDRRESRSLDDPKIMEYMEAYYKKNIRKDE